MTDDLTYTFTVPQTPAEAFAAICDVRAWWSGDIEGRTDVSGPSGATGCPDIHFSAFRITELVPDRSVAWLTTERLADVHRGPQGVGRHHAPLRPAADRGGTQVRFTHEGLVPQVECYGVCRVAWGEYVLGR